MENRERVAGFGPDGRRSLCFQEPGRWPVARCIMRLCQAPLQHGLTGECEADRWDLLLTIDENWDYPISQISSTRDGLDSEKYNRRNQPSLSLFRTPFLTIFYYKKRSGYGYLCRSEYAHGVLTCMDFWPKTKNILDFSQLAEENVEV